MQIQSAITNGVGTLGLDGRFDFNAHEVFMNAAGALLEQPEVKEIHLDLAQVEYLDSSALGMLLLLNERLLKSRNQRLVVARAKGLVRKVLEVAKFDLLMNLR
jgi:anti-anti-sigma factor